MGKAIHILAFTALLILGVSVTDASSIGEASSQAEASAYSYADSSSEEDYCDNTKCKKPNEVYDVCPPSCPARVCGIDDRAIKCKPQPKPGDKNCNKPACRCKNGYYRDNKGNCVEWKKCPQCPANEVYDPCDAPCPERTCAFDPTVVRCAAPPKIGDPACVVGCRCIDGYLRNDKGVCVPQDQCGKCPKNEQYEKCPDTYCAIKKCTDLGFPLNCEENNCGCKCPGKPGCVCKPGYARDSKGKCIKVTDCPSCGGDKNAQSGCGTNCGKKCSDVGKKPPFKCPPGCQYNGCDCKDGFYYDEIKKMCVPPQECPKKCKKNEVFVKCPEAVCRPKTCNELGFPVPCPDLSKDKCPSKPGCICIQGYVRDANGVCVPVTECPSCGGDKNAESGCGNNCGKKCSDVGKKPPFDCPPGCQANGCDCKDGFYYDANKKKCVRPEECPKKCKKNEVFVKCPEAVCRPKTCKDLGFPVPCPDLSKDKCPSKPGCICIQGYVRDAKGVCVPVKECPSCGGDKNAESGCGNNCGKKCSDVGKKPPFDCPPGCQANGCDCKDGFYYDANKKKCVRPEECPKKCKKNEVFVKCPEAVCRPKTCKDLGFPVPCPDLSKDKCPSKPGCICIQGYVRDAKGVCVPVKECPSCGGDKNAESGCGNNCGKKCSDVGKKPPFDCPPGCQANGCDCKDGFYYDANKKKCVRPEECPKKCKKNEVFVKCPEAVCRPKTCKDLGFPVPCPDLSKDKCPSKPGCICIQGYVRDAKGVCVPVKECPSCGGDKNAESGCGNNCGKKCSDVGKKPPFDCPPGCQANGCDCKDGFYYDANKKKCVRPEECPKKCKKNEVFVKCPEAVCRPKTCKDLGFPVPCPDLSKDKCPSKPGCICIQGYVRDAKGVCVPVKECPSCGGDKNAESGCGNNCGKKCSDVGKKPPFDCPPGCQANGCDCKDGFYYDANKKKCVRPEECPKECKKNEVFVKCPEAVCRPKTCKDLGFPVPCIDLKKCKCPSKPGCICIQGYVRDAKGVCVPVTECPSCGGDKNAESGCGNNCGKKCSDVGKKPPFDCPPGCQANGCDCKDGFYYDANKKKCVRPEECPKECKKNEVFVKCPEAVCRPKTCKDLGFPVPCIDPKKCKCPSKPGCICIQGYVRDAKGVCVPVKECPSCGGDKNAESGCGNNCGKKCSDVGKKPPFDCPPGCQANGCDCKDGFYYDANKKKCVRPEECPTTCKKNEVFDKCPETVCRPKTCEEVGFPIDCKDLKHKCKCDPRCICVEGYAKDSRDVCVPVAECPSCGGDVNAVAGCGTNCGKRCSDIDKKKPCKCPDKCIPNGCECKKDFYYDTKKNKCVRPCDCPRKTNTQTCKKNEILVECPISKCNVQTCDQLGFEVACPAVACSGVFGCICKDGYLRNSNGVCIPQEQCPSCGGDANAKPGCGGNCGKKCSDLGKSGPRVCPLACRLNGCDCKDGYYYDETKNKCVLPSECTTPPSCRANEVLSSCANGGCRRRKCTDLDGPILCIDPIKCEQGCICADGYYLDANGNCVSEEECRKGKCSKQNEVYDQCYFPCYQATCDYTPRPELVKCPCVAGCRCRDGYVRNNDGDCIRKEECVKKCTKPNEVYDECPASCPPRVCGIDDTLIDCKPQPIPGDPDCNKPACRCKDGYYRDNKGNCVLWKHCPKCTKPNEIYDPCDSPCPERTCSFDPRVVRCAAPPKIGDPACVIGCRCEDGYLRNDKGICVPQDQCKKCGKNERYENCPATYCLVKACTDIGFPLNCIEKPDDGSCPGNPGCICEQGYVRNNKGVCVKIDQCPSCGGDPNAKMGCGINCGKKCSDVGKKGPFKCPLGCRYNGCDCKNGYYYDANKKKCVKPHECSGICKENEVYNDCPDTYCLIKSCSDLGFPIKCKEKLKDGSCPGKPGCICAPGYARDSKGKCIKIEQCPSCGGDKNAVSGCGINCGKKCKDVGKTGPFDCPPGCRYNGCDCRDGFYNNPLTGKCVRAKDCPQTCKKNEIFVECPEGACAPKTCKEVGFPIPCPDYKECPSKPGCICAGGYVRNSKGVCIPATECPSCGGDPNAKVGCGTNCGKKCSDVGKKPPFNCPIGCSLYGCDCKDGFYYDENRKKCVPPNQCPAQTCNANEVLVKCPIAACRPNTCAELGFPVACPTIIGECPSKPACLCVGGYVRNSDGVCIPATECPSCGGDVNAQAGCGSNCGKMCSDLSNTEPYSCPMGCRLYGCNCKDGFYYNEDTKKCVPPNECPNFQQANSTCSAYTGSVTALTVGNNLFTAKFLYQLMKVNPGTNVIASAFSVLHILANLFLYTKGDTSTEIMKILNVKTKEEIRCAFTQFLDIVQSKEVELSLASKIFLAKKFSLSPSFKKDTNEIFRASAESIDFEKSTDAANTINNWVSDATKGKIKDLVTARMFDLYTRLVLTNAIYFKGAWKQQFNLQSTKKDKFYVNSKKTKKVDMMQLRSSLYYYDHPDLDAKTVALPYKDSNVTFVVILPNKIDGLSNLVEKLQVDNNFDTAVATFAYGPVNLFMPKFEISTTTNLAKLLKQIGVKTIFTDDAQLDGMIIPNQPLKVSAAVQKAFIVVDEKGSEAAAANAFVVRHRITSARKPPKDFILRVDHPFVYAIKVQKTIVFCGLYSG